MSATLLALLLGCRPGALPVDSGGTGGDGGGPSEGEDGGGPGDGGGDTGIEHVGGLGEQPPPLCQLRLECAGTIVDEPKIDCSFEVEAGNGTVVYQGGAAVELRGRSSSVAAKPGYGLELRGEGGEEVEANLLGMGAESDWVLDGLYYDRSLVRDALAYDLFRAMGEVGEPSAARWAPEHRFCELSLDGQPRGVYALVERVKRADSRIDIPSDDAGRSFVLKQDDQGALYALSMAYGGFKLIYPKAEEATQAQQDGVSAWLAGWEGAAFSSDPGDPERGVFAWVGLDGAVDFVLLQEFMKNNDAYFLSVHAWKGPDGLVQLSPWDLDLTLGQPSYNDNEAWDSWIAYRPTMIDAMAGTEIFQQAMAERWIELRAGPLADEAVLARIDGYQQTLGGAIARNWEIWDITAVVFLDPSYLYPVESYAEEDAAVRAWIPQRLAWMDEHVARYDAEGL